MKIDIFVTKKRFCGGGEIHFPDQIRFQNYGIFAKFYHNFYFKTIMQDVGTGMWYFMNVFSIPVIHIVDVGLKDDNLNIGPIGLLRINIRNTWIISSIYWFKWLEIQE